MLENKVIVVTGGAGLLGREFIKSVVENNGVAVIADISHEAGMIVKDTILSIYPDAKIEVISLDITSKNSINTMIDTLHNQYGSIDALVNNAYPRNQNYGRNFFEVEYEDFCENLNLNLGGYFLTTQQMALYFKQQGYGNVVNIASIYGTIAPRFEIYENTSMSVPVEYAAIKSALIQLTKYMAKYFKGTNIRVNAISPGGIFNNQADSFLEKYNAYGSSKGMLAPSDINGTLLYLLSDMSKFVNGQNLIVDDGWTL
jgi:NAD(P)-dependent dehydrogenase (short-subunit alcohol dehydrogenase family)